MQLHHGKHHQTYVANLNKALEAMATAVKTGNVTAQIAQQAAIKFNGGGHINHSLFWKNLAPFNAAETKTQSAPSLMLAITSTWGTFEEFKETFTAALLGIQGSGWGWLVKEDKNGGRLAIITTKDQDPVVDGGTVPIIGVDMWEHAYYLQVSHRGFPEGAKATADLFS